jgi:hypothetical protein
MRGRSDVAAGVFVAALVLLLVSVLQGWTPLAWVCGAVMLGVLAATARQRRTGPDPTTVIRPGDERAWQRRRDDSE